MKAEKNRKSWMCGALVMALGVSMIFSQSKAFAVDRIDVSRECSLTIEVAEDIEAQNPELRNAEIPITLYKIADMAGNAEYTPLEGFEEIGLDKIGSDTTASDWAQIAEKACQALGRPYNVVEEKEPEGENEPEAEEPKVSDPVKSEFTVKPGDGANTLGSLDCGLYLVYVEETLTENYVYHFIPYLVSLPTSDYTIENGGTDTWTYDVTMGLKPQRDTRYGELVIEKTLNTVNTSMGGATCIFLVEAVKDGEVVYSNVVSLNFTEPGKKQIVIDEIPMGAEVTVTEIYAGAGYELISDPEVHVTVVTPENPEYPATAEFTNDYEYPGYGTSVVNHFEHIGEGWKWNPQEDHAGSIGEE